MERRLAAILAADVKGCSRLKERNEEASTVNLRMYRAVVEESISAHKGRIFSSAGDGVVARRGQVDGVCIYFKAIFDEDISFSTGPDSVKTHWPMLLYRTPVRIYRAGETFEMQVEVPDLSEHVGWAWQIDS